MTLTTSRDGTGPTAEHPRRPSWAPARRWGVRPPGRRGSLIGVQVLIVTTIVFQRFVVPVPDLEVSVALPVALLVTGVLVLSGQAVADVRNTVLYCCALGACVIANMVSTTISTLAASFTSTELLAALYLPFCVRLRPELRRRFPEVLDFFQKIMVVAAVVCLLQLLAQLAGWQSVDLMREVLPAQLLVPEDAYNYTYEIYYGSSILKSNGVVFLEASFASQFLALAIIVQILLGGGRLRLVLFGAALISTLSGTGLLLLAGGLALLAVRRGGLWAGRALAAVGTAVLLISLTPAWDLLADRVDEPTKAGSSGHTRLVTPYVNVADAMARDPSALLFGRGGGSIERDVDFFNPYRVLADYTALPKLVGEYGVPAALLFVAFVLTVFLMRTPSPTVGFAAVMLFFVLSGSLLQPPIVVLCWTLTGLFAAAPPSIVRYPVRPLPSPRRDVPTEQPQ
jgi:hypothetical protein